MLQFFFWFGILKKILFKKKKKTYINNYQIVIIRIKSPNRRKGWPNANVCCSIRQPKSSLVSIGYHDWYKTSDSFIPQNKKKNQLDSQCFSKKKHDLTKKKTFLFVLSLIKKNYQVVVIISFMFRVAFSFFSVFIFEKMDENSRTYV